MKRLIVILSILVLAVGCREPRSLERFVKGEGPYRFIVDMSDTSAVYDFDFYTRIDIHGADIPAQAAIDVCWISPSGEELAETVYLPLAREVYAPYRAGLTPSEPGVWILIVTFPSPPKGLTGLGLVSRKVPIAEQSQLTGYLPPQNTLRPNVQLSNVQLSDVQLSNVQLSDVQLSDVLRSNPPRPKKNYFLCGCPKNQFFFRPSQSQRT